MGYLTYKLQIVLLLAVNLLRVLAISTRLEQESSTSKKHRNNLGTLPIPEWELGLREAIYQALVNENKLQIKNLHEFIHAAPLLRRQNSATPFGDIVIMGRGQLYSAPGGFQLLQDYYTNDCDGCHNPPPRCERIPCEDWKPQDHERLLALWTAKRIRHRDSQYGYRYEFEYKISPMSMVANERFVTRNGNFDYSVSGYIFVVRVDPQQTSHRFYRHPNQAYDFYDTFNSPTWTPSSSTNDDDDNNNNYYLPPPIPTIDEYNDPDPRKQGFPNGLYNAPNYHNDNNRFTTTTTTTTTTERHINDREFEDDLFKVTTNNYSTVNPTGSITTPDTNIDSIFMQSSSKTSPTTVLTSAPVKITQPMRTSSLPFLPTVDSHLTSTTHENVYTTFTPSTSDYATRLTSNVEVSTRTTRGTKNTKPYPVYSSTVITSPLLMSFEPSPTKTTTKFTTSRYKTTGHNINDFDIFGENSNNMRTTSGYAPITIVTTPTPNLQNKKPNTNIEGTLQSELFDNFEPKLPTIESGDGNISTTKITTITSTEPETTMTSTTRMMTKTTTDPQNNKNGKPNTGIEGTLQSEMSGSTEPKLPKTSLQPETTTKLTIRKTTKTTNNSQRNKNREPNTSIEGTLQSELFGSIEPKLPKTSLEPETTTKSTIRKTTKTTNNSHINKNRKPNTSIEGTLQSELFDNTEPRFPKTSLKPEATTKSTIRKTTKTTNNSQGNKNRKPNTSIEGTLQSELFDDFEPKLPTIKSQDESISTTKTTVVTSTEPETTTSTTRKTTIKYTTERRQSTPSFIQNDKVTRPTFYSTKAKTFSPFKTMVFSVPLTTSPTFTMYATKMLTKPSNIFEILSTTLATSTKQKASIFPATISQSDLTWITTTPADIINTTQQKLVPTTVQETSTLENSDLTTTDIAITSSKIFDIATSDNTSENVLTTSNVYNMADDSNTTPTLSIVTRLNLPIFTIPERTTVNDDNMVTQRTTKLSILAKMPITKMTIIPSAPTTPTYDFFTTQQIRPIATTMRSIHSTPTTKLKTQHTLTTRRSSIGTSVGTTDNFLFDKNINDLPKVTKGVVAKENNFYFDIFGETFATKSTSTTSKIPFKTKEIDDIFGKELDNNKQNKIKVQSSAKPKNEPEIIYADFYAPSTIDYSNKSEKFDETTKLPNSNLFQKNESRPTESEHLTSQSYITSVSYKVNKKTPITTETYDDIGTNKFQEVSSHLNGNDTDITTKTDLSSTTLISCNETNPQTHSTKSLDALALTVLNNAKSITYLNSNSEQTTRATMKYKRRNGYKLRKFRRT